MPRLHQSTSRQQQVSALHLLFVLGFYNEKSYVILSCDEHTKTVRFYDKIIKKSISLKFPSKNVLQ